MGITIYSIYNLSDGVGLFADQYGTPYHYYLKNDGTVVKERIGKYPPFVVLVDDKWQPFSSGSYYQRLSDNILAYKFNDRIVVIEWESPF